MSASLQVPVRATADPDIVGQLDQYNFELFIKIPESLEIFSDSLEKF